MVKYRRAIALVIAVPTLVCATLSLIYAFDIADVPAGRFLGALTWLLLAANWAFLDVSRRWRTSKVVKTEY